jgi:hypothetical protein
MLGRHQKHDTDRLEQCCGILILPTLATPLDTSSARRSRYDLRVTITAERLLVDAHGGKLLRSPVGRCMHRLAHNYSALVALGLPPS